MRSRSTIKYFCYILLSTLVACNDDTKTTTLQDNISETSKASAFVANFKLSSNGNEIPFPNNLLFSGSQDGTLNIPIDGSDTDFGNPQVALNTLDGFSTIAPMSTVFSDVIDSTSIVPTESIRIFQVTLSAEGAITAVNSELSVADFTASVSAVDSSQSTLVITPLTPLNAKSAYLVVLTNELKSSSGINAKSDLMYEVLRGSDVLINAEGVVQFEAFKDANDPSNVDTATQLEGLRLLTNNAEAAIVNFTIDSDSNGVIRDLNKSDIVLSWTFTTQSISDVLENVYGTVQSTTPTINFNSIATTQSPLGKSDIHVATLTLPYYLTVPTNEEPLAALQKFWMGLGGSFLTQFNTTPEKTSDVVVPLLVSVPNENSAMGETKPNSGWPIVIFQHGITSNRSAIMGIADTLADIGYVAIAMDLPLHGLSGTEESIGILKSKTSEFDAAVTERHFEMDLVNNTTALSGPDGSVDDSGTHFINLASILTSRDNVRQSVADLFVLTKAVTNLDIDGSGTDIDTSKLFFVGHSLGGIVGATYLGIETNVKASVLASPGGGIAKLVDGSATFGPVVALGLAANGVIKGTTTYESFLGAMQMALDSADPINYSNSVTNNRGLLLLEVVGGNTSSADRVVPNNVLADAPSGTVPSPTAGTTPLAQALGLTQVNSSQAGDDLQLWLRFNAGHHSSVLSPNDMNGNSDTVSATVTTEMQTQISSFLATDAANLTVNDLNAVVVEP